MQCHQATGKGSALVFRHLMLLISGKNKRTESIVLSKYGQKKKIVVNGKKIQQYDASYGSQ
jgi:hypothetical protein